MQVNINYQPIQEGQAYLKQISWKFVECIIVAPSCYAKYTLSKTGTSSESIRQPRTGPEDCPGEGCRPLGQPQENPAPINA